MTNVWLDSSGWSPDNDVLNRMKQSISYSLLPDNDTQSFVLKEADELSHHIYFGLYMCHIFTEDFEEKKCIRKAAATRLKIFINYHKKRTPGKNAIKRKLLVFIPDCEAALRPLLVDLLFILFRYESFEDWSVFLSTVCSCIRKLGSVECVIGVELFCLLYKTADAFYGETVDARIELCEALTFLSDNSIIDPSILSFLSKVSIMCFIKNILWLLFQFALEKMSGNITIAIAATDLMRSILDKQSLDDLCIRKLLISVLVENMRKSITSEFQEPDGSDSQGIDSFYLHPSSYHIDNFELRSLLEATQKLLEKMALLEGEEIMSPTLEYELLQLSQVNEDSCIIRIARIVAPYSIEKWQNQLSNFVPYLLAKLSTENDAIKSDACILLKLFVDWIHLQPVEKILFPLQHTVRKLKNTPNSTLSNLAQALDQALHQKDDDSDDERMFDSMSQEFEQVIEMDRSICKMLRKECHSVSSPLADLNNR